MSRPRQSQRTGQLDANDAWLAHAYSYGRTGPLYSEWIGIDQIPVSSLFGEELVLDLSSKPVGSRISASDLREKLDVLVQKDDFVLCYTGTSDLWGNPKANSNFGYLSVDGAKYLVS